MQKRPKIKNFEQIFVLLLKIFCTWRKQLSQPGKFLPAIKRASDELVANVGMSISNVRKNCKFGDISFADIQRSYEHFRKIEPN